MLNLISEPSVFLTKYISKIREFLLFPVALSFVVLPGTAAPSALVTKQDFEYVGAFRLPEGMFGESDFSYAEGPIAHNPDNNSLYVVGHSHQQAISEVRIPNLVNSQSLSDLKVASSPLQNFSRVLNRGTNSPSESIDRIGGMGIVGGKLFVHGYNFYNADGTFRDTTLILDDKTSMASSSVRGFLQLDGAAHAAGYVSEVPQEWRDALGGTHLSGLSGVNIAARTSVGPSAYVWNPASVSNTANSGDVSTVALVDYSLENPLDPDFYNDSRENDIWTFLSKASFGFIVPGTRTFAAIGYSGGHEFGAGYKPMQDTGNVCGGPCSLVADDNYNYYWLYDVNDLVKVKNGEFSPHELRPYEYGIFETPLRTSTAHKVSGGTYDAENNLLYLSVVNVDAVTPVILAFRISGATYVPSETATPPAEEAPDETEPPQSPLTALPPSNLQLSVVDADTTPPSEGGSIDPAGNTDGPQILEFPAGNTVVTISNTSELESAMSGLQDNTTLLLSPGTYNLSSTLYIRKNNVVVAGTGNSPAEVALVGMGMDNASYGSVPHGIWSDALDLTVSNLTIKEMYTHGIILNPGAERPHIHNVALLDIGEQFIKANPFGYGDGVDDGIVEFVLMEYTSGPPSTNHGAGLGYTNGVDVHGGNNWVIRNNVFKNFHTPDNSDHLTNPAILMWNGARNSLAEGNVFIDVDRAISFGLYDNPSGNDHSGGVIKNNMITYSSGLYSSSRTSNSDGAIIVWDSPNTKVLHNTILTNGNVLKAVEFRFDTAGSEARNNLTDAPITARGGSPFVASGNQESASTQLFVDPSVGNLHLKAGTTKAGRLGDVLTDVDGSERSSSTDIGADQF